MNKKSGVVKTKDLFHDKLNLDRIKHTHYECKDMSVKDCNKEYEVCEKCDPKDNKKFGYVQLYYGKSPFVYVTTPIMVCPFGLNKDNWSMNLQFSGYKESPEMKSFYEFIQNLEYFQMSILGLNDKELTKFVSQIKHDKKKKYDPNLLVKIPFSYNKFNADIYSETYSGVNIFNISKWTRMRCDIYLDKLWKVGDVFVGKWKVNTIHLV
jgi:hypothetical protein